MIILLLVFINIHFYLLPCLPKFKNENFVENCEKVVEKKFHKKTPWLSNKDDSYYEDVYQNTNGVLFPGGGQNLLNSTYTHSMSISTQFIQCVSKC